MDTAADVGSARRWLAGLLVVTYLLDLLSASGSVHWSTLDRSLLPLLLPVLLACCALYAPTRPAAMALTGCAVLLGGSVLIYLNHSEPPITLGVPTVPLTELAAGAAMVVVLAWRASAETAVWCTTALVAAGLGALLLRVAAVPYLAGRHELAYTALTGMVLLLASVGTGLYLRRSTSDPNPQRRQLLRRQWPLAAALVVVGFLDLAAVAGPIEERAPAYLVSLVYLVPLAGGVISALCAYLGPQHPVRMTALAAAATTAAAVVMLPAAAAAEITPKLPLPLTGLAAHMALIAYVTRYAERQTAVLAVAALVVSDVLALLPSLVVQTRHATLVDLQYYLLLGGFLLVVAAATGQYFRSRDRERNQSVQAAVAGAQQSERMALARELHDVVAHHVTGIVVQAQAARLVADREPEVAAQALARIEASGTQALAAMRMLVGSMRGAPPAGSSAATEQATSDLAADLRSMVDALDPAAGPTIHLRLDLPGQLPQEVGRSVLRLVQESLTNVGKHASNATTVDVTIKAEAQEVTVSVADDGTAAAGAAASGGSGGYGLIGMRERVELLGGRFDAGPGAAGGWTVRARLPLRKEDR